MISRLKRPGARIDDAIERAWKQWRHSFASQIIRQPVSKLVAISPPLDVCHATHFGSLRVARKCSSAEAQAVVIAGFLCRIRLSELDGAPYGTRTRVFAVKEPSHIIIDIIHIY